MRRFLGFLAIALMLIAVSPAAFCQTMSDLDTAGGWDYSNDTTYWRYDSSGNQLPGTDDNVDIGSASLEVKDIYSDGVVYCDSISLNGVAKTSWGSVISPWEDNGTTTYLTSNPTGVRITNATGVVSATTLQADTGGVLFRNGQNILGETDNSLYIVENSDAMRIQFDGNNVVLDSSDGGFDFTLTDSTDGKVRFFPNNDNNDGIEIKTTSNVPIINAYGAHLTISADNGWINFSDDTLISTGGASLGAVTASSLILGSTLVDATSSVLYVIAGEGADSGIALPADDADDGTDTWAIKSMADSNLLQFENAGTARVAFTSTGGVTSTGDVLIAGTTPRITVGDGGSEVSDIVLDGAGSFDTVIGIDATNSSLHIGLGTLSAYDRIKIPSSYDSAEVIIGDGQSHDQILTINGQANDFSFYNDQSTSNFIASVDATQVFVIDSASYLYGNKMLVRSTTTNDTLAAASTDALVIVNTSGSTITLPTAAAGLRYRIAAATPSTVVIVSPGASDRIGLPGYDVNVDVQSTGATLDSIELIGGTNIWYPVEWRGTWGEGS